MVGNLLNRFLKKRGLEPLSRTKRRTRNKPHTCRLTLEELQSRVSPAVTFVWDGAVDGVWEDANNWDGPVGMFPNAADHIALFPFNGTTSVTMQTQKSIDSIVVQFGFTGTLFLQDLLTLENGGAMAGGTIVQKTPTAEGPITISGGTFNWSGGRINDGPSVTGASSFNISSGAVVDIQSPLNQNPLFLGSHLNIEEGASLLLNNTGRIALVNSPTITNAGSISINTAGGSLWVDPVEPVQTVQNSGNIQMTVAGIYRIDDPVHNLNDGMINLTAGANLSFVGADPITGFSVNQSSGEIRLAGGGMLGADHGLNQTGGLIYSLQNDAMIRGDVTLAGGTLEFAALAGPNIPASFWITGNLTWTAGAIRIHFDKGNLHRGVIRVQGNQGVTVNTQNAIIQVSFEGIGAQPNDIPFMFATNTTGTIQPQIGQQFIINNVPMGYGAARRAGWLGRPDTELFLRRQAGGGMGGAGGMVWRDYDQDGLQEQGEFPFSGVNVSLYTDGDTFVASTPTDAYGRYSFLDLPPGNYYVLVDNPNDLFEFSPYNQGSDDTLDSEADPYGKITFTVVADEFTDYLDAGLYVGETENEVPIVNDDYYSIVHDSTLTTYTSQPEYGVLDTDWDDDPLTVFAVNGMTFAVGTPLPLSSGATLTMNADGTFVYVPGPGFVGQDSFTYTVTDGLHLETATAYISVTNDAPYAGDDAYSVIHDQTLITYTDQAEYGVAFNDWDMDGDTIWVSAVNSNSGAVGTSYLLPSGATLTMNANGSFTYTPAASYVGQDSFTYTISDGIASSIGTVTIAVTNQPPFASSDYYSTPFQEALDIAAASGLLSNDWDEDGDELNVTKVNGNSASVGSVITLASGSTLTVNEDGSFTYTPAVGFSGIDSFTYEITDGFETSLATVYIDVFPY